MTAQELHSRVLPDDDFIILGQRLLPLKIGHVELLAKYDCEFPSNPGDLALAVLICCQEPHEVIPWFKAPNVKEKLSEIARQLGEWDFQEKLALWNQYWEWNTKLPTLISKGNSRSSQSGVPFHQMLRVILLSKLGYRPSEIADVSILQAKWDVAALAQLEGKVTVADCDIDDDEPLTEKENEELDSIARSAIEGLSKGVSHGR